MQKELMKSYESKKAELKKRLEQFKELSEEDMFLEHLFCLLTPQSKAQRCWEAVQEIKKLPKSEWNKEKLIEILKSRTRFHHTKATRLLQAEKNWDRIKPLLNNTNRLELRNNITDIVNGYGLKEAGHFLRNIGKSDNQIAILDRHILRNLKALGVIKDEKLKGRKNYLETEQAFLKFAKQTNIPADELDLLWWSQENGEIFK